MDRKGYQFTIEIGGITIEIRCKYRLILEQCREYLTDKTPDIFIRSEAWNTEDKFPKDREGQVSRNNRNEPVFTDSETKESLDILRKIMAVLMQRGFLLMHGAVVEKDGEAYIFTAPSGTGKSTRLRFWMELFPDSTIVNGDKPLIRVTGSRAVACGTPWAGKEGWSSNIQVPIRAIYLLERAEEDSVSKIGSWQAMQTMLLQTYSSLEKEQEKTRMLAQMAGKVHFFRYQSTMTKESVRMAYEAAQAAGPIQ